MGGRVERGQLPGNQLPGELLKLQGRFAAWRDQRRAGQRIPVTLWNDASKLAEKLGLHRTASVLKLDYYSLKKRLEQNSKNTQPKNTQPSEIQSFVELSTPLLSDSRQCTIELEDLAGARMRICLKGYDAPDVVALSQQFWESD
jgi:hypothetical protein